MSATSRGVGICLALTLTLAGCGGGTDLPPAVPPIDGLLAGTLTRSSGTVAVSVAVSNGRFMAVDAGGVSFDGRFTVAGTRLTGTAMRIYATPVPNRAFTKAFTETATWSGTVDTNSGWTGSLVTAGSQTISFSLAYDRAGAAQDSALSFVQGNWRFVSGPSQSDLAIDAAGATQTVELHSGAPANCNSAGTIAIIDPDFNIYRPQTSISGSGCPPGFAGAYTGLASLGSAAAPLDRLGILLASPEFFLSFLAYARQP